MDAENHRKKQKEENEYKLYNELKLKYEESNKI